MKSHNHCVVPVKSHNHCVVPVKSHNHCVVPVKSHNHCVVDVRLLLLVFFYCCVYFSEVEGWGKIHFVSAPFVSAPDSV